MENVQKGNRFKPKSHNCREGIRKWMSQNYFAVAERVTLGHSGICFLVEIHLYVQILYIVFTK